MQKGVTLHPIALRLIIAGIVVAAGGVAIAASGAGIGEGAVWKGAVVAVMGLCLVGSGVHRQLRGGDASPSEE